MVVDYTITLGNIIEIGSIIGGGVLVLLTLKNDVKSLKRDFAGMQDEIKKLGEILINLADIRGEIKVLNTRVAATEQDIRELRHGDGFVKGPRGVDREY
jgi:hypothetical protein